MTAWQIVAAVFLPAFVMLLALIWGEIAKLRKDVLSAGIDIHQALLEIAAHQRLQSLMPPASRPGPAPADAVGEETPEQWLERQRMVGRRH